jgi:hypothetical protein
LTQVVDINFRMSHHIGDEPVFASDHHRLRDGGSLMRMDSISPGSIR